MNFRTVTWKLAGQRKAREWVVTCTDKGRFIVQGDGCIGWFEYPTGQGMLNLRGEYFIHLNALGAKPFTFPADFVQACWSVVLKPGQQIGGDVFYGGTTEI